MNQKILSNVLKFLLFGGIGFAILAWLYQSQNAAYQLDLSAKGLPPRPYMDKLVQDFRSVHLGWLSLTFLCFTMSNYSRAVRWNMLLRPLGYRPKTSNAFFAVTITYLTNLVLSRAGEVVRAGSLARVEGMSMTKVMATVVVDRLLDLLCLAIIVGFAFLIEYQTLWAYLDKNLGTGDGSFRLLQNVWVWVVIGGGVGVLGVLWLLRERLVALPLVQKVWHLVEKFSEGFKTLRYVESPLMFLFHTVNIWLMYFLMTYFCFFAFDPTAHLTPLAALTVFVFGTFGMVIPSPGGMGTYHFFASAALVIHGISGGDAFSFANIMFFSIQIFYTVVVGLVCAFLMQWLNKKPMSIAAEIVGE